MTEAAVSEFPRRPSASKRHHARRFALQAVYGHLLAGAGPGELVSQLRETEGFARCDGEYFERLLRGTLDRRADLEAHFTGYLDRPLAQLDPVEHAVLLLAAFELACCPELPCRIAINEAVELAKQFGATESHRYINGVVDRMARRLRATEFDAKG